jgi:hypothetical protein
MMLAGCGSSAGSPMGGNTSPNCSTGTLVVLSEPPPGSQVSPKRKVIEIASNAVIVKSGVALAVGIMGGSGNEIRPLYGPLATPSPSPTPSPTPPASPPLDSSPLRPTSIVPQEFPSPSYYAARGYSLQPRQTYAVSIVWLHSACRISRIPGATFRTVGTPSPKPGSVRAI